MSQKDIHPRRIVELRKIADSLRYNELPVLIALIGLRNHQEMVVNMIEDGLSPDDVANTPEDIAEVVDDIESDNLGDLTGNIKAIIMDYDLADHYVVEFRPVLEVIVKKD